MSRVLSELGKSSDHGEYRVSDASNLEDEAKFREPVDVV